ncbi:gliding motility-associated C-terminal domain-containing protein [Lutibacter sp. HS1-25]|uniref:gliding motility-associated C-terminal domain-containing protein n=1 Tax=Lutibacter sp. HS1-25 TaxID=2485000 RepID=UPI00101342D9|nr:gliding motility-associated C-terminal domain-containing protein [Lutibacter sp. HS1-25]RXP52243.1 gliding motility-associated C-terminal domain-containing protein [Lutibacter sp. HS1-25]
MTTVHTQTIKVEDTTAPAFVETLPVNITVQCDAVPTAEVLTATDNCGVATVTFEEVKTAGSCPSSYSLERTWTATDACGLTTVHTQTIKVEDTTAPELSAMPIDIIVSCVSEVPGNQNVTASDICDSNPVVVFTQSELPNCSGEVINTWTATDACGNTIIHNQKVTIVSNVDPVFTGDLPEDLTVDFNEIPVAAELKATDACGNDLAVDYSEVVSGQGEGCSGNYTIIRTWSTKDCSNNLISYKQTISVVDNTAPVIVSAPVSAITVSCSEIPEAGEVVATDNFSTNVQITFEQTVTDVRTNGSYQIIRLWTIADECGNTKMYTQTISVEPLKIRGENEANVCIEDGSINLYSLISGVPNNDNGSWSDDDNSGALSDSEFNPTLAGIGVYHFTYTSGYDTCISSYTVAINVNDDCVVLACESPETIKISKVVTANNDGINDYFEVSDVTGCGFVSAVQIFNRWGKLVFESDNYKNNWSGHNEGGGPTIGSADLPTGTYYYIVNVVGSGFKPITGYIYLGTN